MTVIERDISTLSPFERAFHVLDESQRHQALELFQRTVSFDLRVKMATAWENWWARPNQCLPRGKWTTWMIRAGRGYGKTRSGAEGVRKLVNSGLARYITIVGPTAADARDVMVEGPTGLMHVYPDGYRPLYEPSKRLVSWPNGAVGHVRSGEDPDSLRGLNSDLVWFDEPASMRHGQAAWDNAQLGNRLGKPHSILTGTPRPLPWLKAIEAKASTVLTVGSTYENVANLAPEFVELVLERYEGTRLGAQELHARYLEDVEGALWTMAIIERSRFTRFDRENPWRALTFALAEIREVLGRGIEAFDDDRRRWVTMVGVDPPGETAECGIVVGTAPKNGRAGRDHAVILDDMSLPGPPEVWGAKVVEAYRKWNAELVVVEANQGGDMVRSTIHNVDPSVNVEKLHAKESKVDRAEPVSVLDAKGWVHHLGNLPVLEGQMSTWVPAEGKSPDRIDARVHLVTKLLRISGIGSASLPDQRSVAQQVL